jgi:hypothetical protein
MMSNPIRCPVEGAPYQPGDPVRVVQAIDKYVHDMSKYVGRVGRVAYLEYTCGCGQHYPDDPMVGVEVEGDDEVTEFWREELSLLKGGSSE